MAEAKHETKELSILRRIVQRFKHESIAVRDELDSWGWRNKSIREFVKEAYAEAHIEIPDELL